MPLFIERRDHRRGRLTALWDLIFNGLRRTTRHADTFIAAVGVFLLGGLIVAAIGTWAFSEIAEHVIAGQTRQFDDAVLTWMGQHRVKWIEAMLLELTALGTASTVLVVVTVATLFLSLTRHRYSAFLLLVSTGGGLILNLVLKMYFQRPRPDIFVAVTSATSTSFPSGHAMNAAIAYGTVAYLAARLHPLRWARGLTLLVASVIILLIATSRLYLGVHYPSDVLAGLVIGTAWASFCMASLEAIQRLAERNAPEVLTKEEPAPRHDGS
jgi:undecaprenyl-diphosphatase